MFRMGCIRARVQPEVEVETHLTCLNVEAERTLTVWEVLVQVRDDKGSFGTIYNIHIHAFVVTSWSSMVQYHGIYF